LTTSPSSERRVDLWILLSFLSFEDCILAAFLVLNSGGGDENRTILTIAIVQWKETSRSAAYGSASYGPNGVLAGGMIGGMMFHVGKDVRRLRIPADSLICRITWRMSGCNKPGGTSSEATCRAYLFMRLAAIREIRQAFSG
jgi:hypothetical protein